MSIEPRGSAAVRRVTVALALASCIAPVRAEFAAAVSPPRFELSVQPGQTLRSVLEITHAANSTGRYRVYTNDWSLNAGGEVLFSDALVDGSCRPWVAIERPLLTLAARARQRYRFEVTPAADAPPGECRFALMIDSADDAAATGTGTLPVSGRIGVIVYVRVGDVSSDLRVDRAEVARGPAGLLPALRITNHGRATGRLDGIVTATESDGRRLEVVPDGSPVLPGMTRLITLSPLPPYDKPNDAPPRLRAWPITLRGSLDVAGTAVKVPIDVQLSAP